MGGYNTRNLIERGEPLTEDVGEIVECPVCEDSSHWMSSNEDCPIVKGNKRYKKCELGTYINEVCGYKKDCYRGPGEQCTEKRSFDKYGQKCAPGYYCNKPMGICQGFDFTVDSNLHILLIQSQGFSKMNKRHCTICPEKHIGPDHELTEKHRKNKALNDYLERKKQCSGNRSGVIVKCNVRSNSTTLKECADAKIKISIKPNEKATFDFMVKNDCNKEVILLDFVKVTKSKLNFILTDNGIGSGGNPESIQPNQHLTKKISVTFETPDIGQYEAPIIFNFRKRDFDEVITVFREMVVFVEEEQRVHEKFATPFTKKEVHADKLYHSHAKPPMRGNDMFLIPKNYKDVLAHNLHLKKNASQEEVKSLEEIQRVFEAKVTPENYVQYFHNLLWFEEATAKINIKNFNMAEVYLEKRGSHEYVLSVPGLCEKRPSLMIGDMLHVKPSNSNKVMFQAFIRDIEDNKILIYGLHFEFNTYYYETAKFDIRYFQSRIPPERMHRAVNAIKDRGQESKIFPVGRKTMVKVKKITSFFNNKVETNPEQRRAVENILSETSGTAPFMVHGPPGTGKTVTIVEAILQLVRSNSNNRVLVCTDSNMAADHVASVLIQYKSEFPMEKFILRASSQFRVWETLPECLKPYSNGTNRKNYESVSLKDFKTYNIVVTTLLHAAKYGNEAKKKSKRPPVNHLFIDEAAQASEPACLVPVAGLLAKNGRLVLSGDHQQLGPVVISRGAATRGLGLSLMERLKRDCNLYSDSRNDPNYIVMLRNNFRSNPDILDIPNKLFYNGQLIALAGPDYLSNIDILGDRQHSRAIVFHGVLSKEQKIGKSPSYFNNMEVELVQKYIKALIIKHTVRQEDIGVVTPYIRQVYHIKEWLRSQGYDGIEVGTVEAFQGKEKRVIIISTVRANCGLHDYDAKFRLGFLVDDKRFNVVITRAKAKCIVIGNPLCLQTDLKWRAYMEKCREFGTYLGFDFQNSTNEDTHKEIASLFPLLGRLKISN
ncbi:hypothetical protein K1T71_010892 [Dendrolimus kikuchii]|uniref:Uncharacterized protein n=1 Tax=Dendrolimus kikuchii TaxID=765133 RepID=A0ACC1CQC2_9NEOP|nr:hypothetical protein K1T71_010892 [Dendrolimus kikuchii]